MQISFFRSIRVRLVLTVLVLVGAIVAFQFSFYPARQKRDAIEALEWKGRAMAELVAWSAVSGLEFQRSTDIADIFEGAARDPELGSMVVYNADGSVFVAFPEGGAPEFFDHEFSTKETISRYDGTWVWVTSPIPTTIGDGGFLLAGFSTDRIVAASRESQDITILSGAAILALGALIAFWLATSVGARIGKMAEVAGRVAQGRVDIERVEVGTEDELGQLAFSLNTMLDSLSALEGHIKGVARGDLTSEVQVEGDLADALRAMIVSQRQLVTRIVDTSMEIRTSSAEILATSRAQERGASSQAAFVEQTLRTMDNVLEGGETIGNSSSMVLDNAQRTHQNIEAIAERINQLAKHVERIGEVLELIREIAYKADLLALNAALEGTRAGEAGRGFSHVATQMQSLTESIVGAVEDIKVLTVDIREATTASVLATEEATKRSSDSATSAQQITYVLQQQNTSTQQVGSSMNEISGVIRESVTHATQLATTAEQLSGLAERLQEQVQSFRLRNDQDA